MDMAMAVVEMDIAMKKLMVAILVMAMDMGTTRNMTNRLNSTLPAAFRRWLPGRVMRPNRMEGVAPHS